ncbi:SET domain, bifurcated 1a [Apostichopus japonicus]|uniref:SET domain, bifurcated 1a n=1 Tax=Stichopus japonicus TaxID=307972 RepID=A0A2G8KGB7_STIJA|nr:SET domain, bifurcated 1a [Apostichopus japonicus]
MAGIGVRNGRNGSDGGMVASWQGEVVVMMWWYNSVCLSNVRASDGVVVAVVVAIRRRCQAVVIGSGRSNSDICSQRIGDGYVSDGGGCRGDICLYSNGSDNDGEEMQVVVIVSAIGCLAMVGVECGSKPHGEISMPVMSMGGDVGLGDEPPQLEIPDEEFLPSSRAKKSQGAQKKGTSNSPGSTKVVFRRTSEETSGDSWSVAFAKENAQSLADSPSKILYGYNPNPGKVLDQTQVQAFRQRQEARKQRRSKGQQPKKPLFEAKDDMSSESDSSSVVSMDSSSLKSYEFASKLMEVASKYAAEHPQDSSASLPHGTPTMTPREERQKDEKDNKRKVGRASRERNGSYRLVVFWRRTLLHHGRIRGWESGKVFNHSCSPNLFVQNVFVDTHDLRFPWVAFFAARGLRAGTELTWTMLMRSERTRQRAAMLLW